jgi:hypothetical protein
MTKLQSVSRPRFRSEDDELMTAHGHLAENRVFFGWTDKCLGHHADTFPLAESDDVSEESASGAE